MLIEFQVEHESGLLRSITKKSIWEIATITSHLKINYVDSIILVVEKEQMNIKWTLDWFIVKLW